MGIDKVVLNTSFQDGFSLSMAIFPPTQEYNNTL